MDKRAAAQATFYLPSMFMCSQPTDLVRVYHAVRLERNKEKERMNRRARQEVGNTTLCRSGEGEQPERSGSGIVVLARLEGLN